jgi:DNA-directed RNA polymerase specialized sigma24 family protein
MTIQNELCETFAEHSPALYWLAYVITGDRERAIEAFNGALDLPNTYATMSRCNLLHCARRLVIISAINVMRTELQAAIAHPRPEIAFDLDLYPEWDTSAQLTREFLESALFQLDVFSRCSLLLTVFEKLPVCDAALLLNTDEELVRRAREYALCVLTAAIARLLSEQCAAA